MKTYKKLFLLIFFFVLVWSGINPHDYYTWFLEVLPAFIGLGILIFLECRGFEFSSLVYSLLLVHSIILMIGGHYTYAEVPFFNWLKETFCLDRNYYDRVGHFMQGFVPAILAREIMIRKKIIQNKKWMFFMIVCICLAFSAFYEFFEWWVAVASGTAADAFLGTQGDVWDTQWDMFIALVGSITSLIFLSEIHDKYLKKIKLKR